MKFKLRRRDLFLILAFWLIGAILVGGVVYFVVMQPQQPTTTLAIAPQIRPQATVTVIHTQITAKSLQPGTVNQVASWEEDAQLISIAATWEKTDMNQVGQPTSWTYRFYSPSQRRLYFATARGDGQVTGTSHSERIHTPPYTIPLDKWQMDSPEAINTWLNYGGAVMLTAIPGIQVVAQLQINTPEEPLTWTVAGYDPITKNYHTVFINAETKEVTNIESSLR